MLKFQYISVKLALVLIILFSFSGCAVLLLNGHLSFNHYEAKSGTFKCKIPAGALSSKVEVTDRNNDIGETVTFSLDLGLLWRLDHLIIGKHKLAMLETSADRRQQLDLAKDNYMSQYLAKYADQVEVRWEQYVIAGDKEVLLTNTFVKWEGKEEQRELLFSIDGNYLNIIHHAQTVSSNLKTFTTGAVGFYKSCDFY